MPFVIAWFVIAAFAVTAIGYYLISAQKRRASIRARGASDERRPDLGSFWPRQTIEYVGAIVAVALLGVASAYVVGTYRLRVREAIVSEKQASQIMDEQYHEEHLTDTLLLSAFNNATVAGSNGRVSSSIIIEVKLQERVVAGRCDEKEFALASSAASARLHTPDFSLPDAPAFDNTAKCSVKWSWVAVPLHADTNIALADVTVNLRNKRIIHASKPIILNVVPPYTGVVASSIGSISVAFLSLTGVIFTAIMNNRRRANEPAIERNSKDEPLDAV